LKTTYRHMTSATLVGAVGFVECKKDLHYK